MSTNYCGDLGYTTRPLPDPIVTRHVVPDDAPPRVRPDQDGNVAIRFGAQEYVISEAVGWRLIDAIYRGVFAAQQIQRERYDRESVAARVREVWDQDTQAADAPVSRPSH